MMTSPALMAKNCFPGQGHTSDPLLLLSNSNTLAFSLLGDESCSKLSGSPPGATSSPQSPPPLVNMAPTGMSPTNFAPTEITDVDLNFWELAINSSSSPTATSSFATPPTASTGIGSKSFNIFNDSGSSPLGHDDLSSPSLSNSFSSDPNDKKKKGAVGRQTDELCLVCGDRASGYHYNALTCEGCKGFFRRSITKKAVYNCKYGKSCVMDMYMRRKCQECRFTKCMTVGMRPECVVPEHTCRVKRKQKQEKNPNFTPTQDVSKQQLGNGLPSPLSLSSSLRNCDRMELTKDQQELISRIINSQEVYESPIEPVAPTASIPRNQKDTSLNYSRIMDMTEATIQLIVKFATKLPGFLAISQQDQITLLKEASGELLLLRASRRYHVDTDTIVFADNTPCTREFYMTAGMNPYSVEILFNFCKKMATMKVDNAEYGLLSAIILFSERPALTNSSRVQKIQYLYVETLCAYVTNKAPPNSGMMVAKLLDVLTQLRTLVILTYEECEYFLSKDMPLPDLLKEMWDITNQKTQNFDHSSLFLD